MKKLILVTLFSMIASAGYSKPSQAPEVLKACQKECPEAKNDLEAFGCGEVLEHNADNAAFKSSTCYKFHKAYEAWMIAQSKAKEPKKKEKVRKTINLVIKKDGYDLKAIEAPRGTRIRLVIHNETGSAEEFESPSLQIVDYPIPVGAPTVLEIGPFEPGEYKYTGDNVSGGILTIK
jgi:hypothetical protein